MKRVLIYFIIVANFGLENGVESGTCVDENAKEITAKPGQFPHQVSLHYLNEKGDYVHICGGAIISSNLVITAAHCVYFSMLNHLRIIAGCYDLRYLSVTQQRNAKKIIPHPNYDSEYCYSSYDIALVQIEGSFVLTSSVNIIKLPEPGRTLSRNATLSGWGVGDINKSYEILQKIDVYIISDEDCKEFLSNGEVFDFFNTCATRQSNGRIICKVDDGGPLIQEDILIGIAAYGISICDRAPRVFTEVRYFYDFIKEHMHDGSSSKQTNIFIIVLLALLVDHTN